MDPRVRILDTPKLRKPTLIAAWPGMGLVGFNAVEFLRQTLDAQKVAEIDPTDFFAIQGITAKEGVAVPLVLPSNAFHAAKHPGGGPDLLLFLGTAQPVSGREVALCSLVLQVAASLGVNRVYTAAAMAAQIDHLAPSRPYGVTSREEDCGPLQALGVQMLKEGEIGGLNGLLIGIAQQRGMRGACLMGEMPQYTTHIENPKASMCVLGILASLLDLHLNLEPLAERAHYIEAQIQNFLQQAHEKNAAAQGTETHGESAEGEDPASAEEDSEEESQAGGRKSGGSGPAIN